MGGVMPGNTPRQKLEDRVTARFREMGYTDRWPRYMARQAVDEFYAGDQGGTYFALVAAESYQIIIDTIPMFATNILAAFQSMSSMVSGLADTLGPLADMAEKARVEPPEPSPTYDASGLPVDDGPHLDEPVEHHVDPPVSADIANEVSLEDTGRPLAMPPGSIEVGGVDISDAVSSVQLECEHPADQVIELTEREWHLAAARRLHALDCTYGELEQMASEGAFPTSQHHMAWFSFGGNVRLEQLDRAQFVLDKLTRGDAANIDMDDAAIQRAEVGYPEDRITGAPHHYVVNGDHSGCGCGGHLLECTTWADPTNRHAASICGIARTLCRHSPRHPYRELCSDDTSDGIGIDTLRVRAEFE